MQKRYKSEDSLLPHLKHKPFAALKETFKEGYKLNDLKQDLLSGAVVALVAIPLGMALAIASGVAPQHGLYTIIFGGIIAAILGGSRFQVTGPTAAFVVVLAPIAGKFGVGGLLTASMLAGFFLICMGALRMGRFIEFIPHPVTTGFTSGIALVIATMQIKDFFGLNITKMPDSYFRKIEIIFTSLGTAHFWDFFIGSITLFLLIYFPKKNSKIPAPLIALPFAGILSYLLVKFIPNISIDTIGNRFSYVLDGITHSGIPDTLPGIQMPWLTNDSTTPETFHLTWNNLEELLPSVFAITLLGAIESLLTAVIADGMTQKKHDSDAELIAIGTANLICPFFGGIAATGALSRTATNIRYGARSPFSAIAHGVYTIIIVLIFAKWISFLPMASLAALLLIVSYNMSQMKHFYYLLKVAPKSDVLVLLSCFFLTVLFNMIIGVSVGVVLASLLFMKRMSEVFHAERKITITNNDKNPAMKIPNDMLVYEIAGPLFFGATNKAVDAFTGISNDIKTVVFKLQKVPAIDVSGLVAIESAIERISKLNKKVYLIGLQEQPENLIRSAGIFDRYSNQFLEQKPTLLDLLTELSTNP